MRIRTIKPEFWTHEGLCKCSEFSRLLAIAILNWADDEGYFMANPTLIRGQVFPFEDDSKKVPRSIQELSSVGWIELGIDDQSRAVGRVINFAKHQRVDKPKPSNIKASSTFDDQSKTHLGCVPSGKERKGREEERISPLPPEGELEEKITIEKTEADMLPANANRMKAIDQKRTRCKGLTPTMKRMNDWFGRRETTPWTVAELMAYLAISPTEAEIGGMEAFYLAEDPAEELFRRRDLLTLLNNWQGELDKARGYARKQRGAA